MRRSKATAYFRLCQLSPPLPPPPPPSCLLFCCGLKSLQTATGEAQVDKTIVIKPGWKDGTRITFQREGDEQPNVLPSGERVSTRVWSEAA